MTRGCLYIMLLRTSSTVCGLQEPLQTPLPCSTWHLADSRGCRRWASDPPSASSTPHGEDSERQLASYKAGLAALRAEKEALVQQNGQTWQLLEERTNEIHHLQVQLSSQLPRWQIELRPPAVQQTPFDLCDCLLDACLLRSLWLLRLTCTRCAAGTTATGRGERAFARHLARVEPQECTSGEQTQQGPGVLA